MDELHGARVTLRPWTEDDFPALLAIASTPEVARWWGSWSPEDDAAEDVRTYVVVAQEQVVGIVQWHEETEPDYRHAGMDIFLDPAVHGRGYGTDALRTMARWLISARGHHRLTIDPAAANTRAIAVYHRIGFRPVGVMRRYERGPDGVWRDGLLMDLLADELT